MNRLLSVAPALLLACANPTKDKPKADVAEAKTETAQPAAQTGAEKLPLTADSKLEFIGAKVTRSHTGGFKTFTGEITLVDGDPEKSTISIDIDVASIYTDTDKLTAHLQSPDFFDVAKFPRASFVTTSIKKKDASTYEISGNLDMHGVKKSVTFPATVTLDESQVAAKAEFAINRKDWGIVYAGMADDLIRDDVLIKLDVKAARPKRG